MTERFLAAAVGGDVEELLAVLAPGVVLITDGGGKAKAALRPIVGADKVARFLSASRRRGRPSRACGSSSPRSTARPASWRGRGAGRSWRCPWSWPTVGRAGARLRATPTSSPVCGAVRRAAHLGSAGDPSPPRRPPSTSSGSLCVLAHPDDVDFGSAGTVATWTAAGTEVTYCIVTDGDAGGFDDTPRDRMGPLRQEEQRAAAAAVGVTDVRFLGYPDGRLELTLELRRDISRVIRQVRPQRVLTSSPERFWERIGASHPDHMIIGESTLRAVYPDARNPFAFPELLADEGLEAWTVSEVWLAASPRADHAVDVTDVVELKFAALKTHVSQVGHRADLEKFVTGWMSQVRRALRPARGPPRRGLPRRPHRDSMTSVGPHRGHEPSPPR